MWARHIERRWHFTRLLAGVSRRNHIDESGRHTFPHTDGVYDGSDDEDRRQLEAVMREHCLLPAKDICNALLECTLRKDDHERQIGEGDRIDDKTVFIIKRN